MYVSYILDINYLTLFWKSSDSKQFGWTGPTAVRPWKKLLTKCKWMDGAVMWATILLISNQDYCFSLSYQWGNKHTLTLKWKYLCNWARVAHEGERKWNLLGRSRDIPPKSGTSSAKIGLWPKSSLPPSTYFIRKEVVPQSDGDLGWDLSMSPGPGIPWKVGYIKPTVKKTGLHCRDTRIPVCLNFNCLAIPY